MPDPAAFQQWFVSFMPQFAADGRVLAVDVKPCAVLMVLGQRAVAAKSNKLQRGPSC